MENKTYDSIIIGSGPSGTTAAIYGARADMKVLVVAGNPPGGQLTTTTDVENFPGFPEGIMGPELVNKFRLQAERFGAEFVNENVTGVFGSFEQGFVVKTEAGDEYYGKTVILATGASARYLGLESETRLRGKGVSACATCDGFFFKNKEIAVVGGGDSAMEESTFLTKFASKVHVLVRKDKDSMKASKIMQNRALHNPKIEFHFNTEVLEVLGDDSVSGLRLKNNETGEESKLMVQGLFLAIGHTPNTSFIADLIEVDSVGYAVVKERTKSSVPGIFVAGDVSDHRYRQAITAAGAGCMALLDAEKFLVESGVKSEVAPSW